MKSDFHEIWIQIIYQTSYNKANTKIKDYLIIHNKGMKIIAPTCIIDVRSRYKNPILKLIKDMKWTYK